MFEYELFEFRTVQGLDPPPGSGWQVVKVSEHEVLWRRRRL